ncbi:MAG: ribbon-helix-helix domain-containing protein [Alphaproteobacteria bacterium]|nr:ribbon-helix-helix domain-containing protein [Alphaproteobacteria bacterium]
MKKISIVIANQHQTSITLEKEFYDALVLIAKEKELTINNLITEIDSSREITNLSSAIRVYILKYYQNLLP